MNKDKVERWVKTIYDLINLNEIDSVKRVSKDLLRWIKTGVFNE